MLLAFRHALLQCLYTACLSRQQNLSSAYVLRSVPNANSGTHDSPYKLNSPPPISNQSTWVIYELMCWLSGSLTCRIPNVMRSPPARRSLVSSITVDWLMAPRRWGFYLKSKSTNYPDHGHHGDPPPTRKIPMVEPGIEPGTPWLVARSSDH